MNKKGPKRKDLTGQIFNQLTALEPIRLKNGQCGWLCECSCGNACELLTKDLTTGHTKSCGCRHDKTQAANWDADFPTCSSCGEQKPLSEFKEAISKGWRCRSCVNSYAKSWRNKNPSKSRTASKKWKDSNPEKVKEGIQQYIKSGCSAKYNNERRKTNPDVRLILNTRRRQLAVLKGASKSVSTFQALGIDGKEDPTGFLRGHLESQFKPGMTWDNYGEWHVDHIIPCHRFDLSLEGGRKMCFHYTNLQPLWAPENLRKQGRVTLSDLHKFITIRKTCLV